MSERETKKSVSVDKDLACKHITNVCNVYLVKVEEQKLIEHKEGVQPKIIWERTEKCDDSELRELLNSDAIQKPEVTAVFGSHDILADVSQQKKVKFPFTLPSMLADVLPQQKPNDVTVTESGFKVLIDVKPFKGDEVNVKVENDILIVEANHEEKVGQTGFVRLKFVRKYMISKKVDPKSIKSSVSGDGILTITGNKRE